MASARAGRERGRGYTGAERRGWAMRLVGALGVEVDEGADAGDDGVGAVDEFRLHLAAVVVEAGFEVGEGVEGGVAGGGEIAVAEVADVGGVDELLEGAGDGETEDGFAEGEGFADEVVAGGGDGEGGGGEVGEDLFFVEGFEGEVAFRSCFVADAVDDCGTRETVGDIEEGGEGGGGLVDEDVIARGGAEVADGGAEDGREQFVLAVGFEFGMEEGGDEVVAGVIEEEGVFESAERPGDELGRRDVVAADLEDVRMVEREDREAGAVGGMRQEEFAVADGDVGLPAVDEVENLAGDAWEVGGATGEMAARARDRDALVLVDGVSHWHFQDGVQAAQDFGNALAADEVKFVLGEPARDGERARHVAERVAHYAVEDSCHGCAEILLMCQSIPAGQLTFVHHTAAAANLQHSESKTGG